MRKPVWTMAAVLALTLLLSVSGMAKWGTPVLWEHTSDNTQRMPWLCGDKLYFAENYDIMVSTWDGSKWSAPEPVPGAINTGANEINPALAQDGKVLYFGRYDPITDYDFYRSEWDEAKQEWGKPELVEELSSDTQEWDIWVSNDETVAYLTSKGAFGGTSSVGGQDIWKAVKEGDKWGTPVNLAALNSDASEWSVFVGPDGTIYFDSSRDGSVGDYDIWTAVNDTAVPVNLGTPINSEAAERAMTFNDKFFIFAGSKREGRSGYDLWVAPKEGVVTIIQQAPAAVSALPFEITGELGGSIKFQFTDDEAYVSEDNKWKNWGYLRFKANPFQELESYVAIRFATTADVEMREAHVAYTTDPLKLRWFWNESVDSFEDPFQIINGELLEDNYNYDSNYFNGLETRVNLLGTELYGLLIPRFTSTADVWAFQLRHEFGPVMARKSFARYADQPGFQRVYTWDAYDATVAVGPNLSFAAEYATLSGFWGSSTKTEMDPQKATYLKADYDNEGLKVSGSYRVIDPGFTNDNSEYTAPAFNSVEDAFTPDRTGFTGNVAVPVHETFTLRVGRDQFTNIAGDKTYTRTLVAGDMKLTETLSGSVDVEFYDDDGEKKTVTTVAAKQTDLGLDAEITVEKAESETDAATSLSLTLAPISMVTFGLDYESEGKVLRGQVDWDVTKDIAVCLVAGTRDSVDDRLYYYGKITKTFGTGNEVYASLGNWDDGSLSMDDDVWESNDNLITLGGKVTF